VLELCTAGDLFGLVEGAGALPPARPGRGLPAARGLLRQLVSAVAYCHARQVWHRDLKL
jgi:serine/threonine protein kinase